MHVCVCFLLNRLFGDAKRTAFAFENITESISFALLNNMNYCRGLHSCIPLLVLVKLYFKQPLSSGLSNGNYSHIYLEVIRLCRMHEQNKESTSFGRLYTFLIHFLLVSCLDPQLHFLYFSLLDRDKEFKMSPDTSQSQDLNRENSQV